MKTWKTPPMYSHDLARWLLAREDKPVTVFGDAVFYIVDGDSMQLESGEWPTVAEDFGGEERDSCRLAQSLEW